ncbi:MAG: PKD domain-containing protein [Thaumarchaeota archaeon]|nr:PKD domain-containing protein [Nitrososphaerota archaeon]
MKKSTCLVYIILTIVTISTVIALNPARAVDTFPMTLTYNPHSGNTPLTVSFSLNLGSTTSKNVEWNFGDGSPHDTTNKLTITHVYQKSGNFTGTVNVVSSKYQSQSQAFSVNVGVAPTTTPTTINNQTTAHQILNITRANTPPIIVTTDLQSYNQGESIIIKGSVRDIENETAITVRVFSPLKNLIAIGQFIPTSTGSFSDTIKANGPLWTQAGNYTVIAQYGKYQNDTTTFHYSGGNGQIIANTVVTNSIYQINGGGQTYSVPYAIKGGIVKSMDIYADKLTLEITIAATSDGSISVDLPRSLMDAKVQSPGANPIELPDDKFIVMINGNPVQFTETKDNTVRSLSISFHASDTKIDIIGTQIVPEFGPIAALVLAIAIISIIAVSAKTGLRFMPKY